MKIYSTEIKKPSNDKVNRLLLSIFSVQEMAKESLDTGADHKLVGRFYNDILRDILNLENKVFAITRNADCTKAWIIYFDKEPDGNTYEVFRDEDTGKWYILVED